MELTEGEVLAAINAMKQMTEEARNPAMAVTLSMALLAYFIGEASRGDFDKGSAMCALVARRLPAMVSEWLERGDAGRMQ